MGNLKRCRRCFKEFDLDSCDKVSRIFWDFLSYYIIMNNYCDDCIIKIEKEVSKTVNKNTEYKYYE